MKAKKNQKQISIEEYIRTYCQEKRIRGRFAVYISPETHEKLKKIVRIFYSEYYTTTSSLADSIISYHIETHRELLDDLYKENSKLFRIDKESPKEKDLKSSQEDDEA